MRKLSILIALILCVTIGGVYATWNYAQGAVDDKQEYLDGNTTALAGKVETTDKGTITIDDSQLQILIDDTNNDLEGELYITGSISVTFTPNQGADADVVANGVSLQFTLSSTENFNYNGNPIFTLSAAAKSMGMVNGTVTISAADLQSMITLNPLSLPTAVDYDAFRAALHSGSLIITVSEANP